MGKFHLESTVPEWVQLDSQYTEAYCTGVLSGNKNGFGPELQECLRNALEKVDGSVDFGSFDTNGDGYIDAITFIHSSYCAATSGADDNVWSHQFYLEEEFTSQEGVKVSPYHINPAWQGYEGNKMSTIAVISHEMSHFLVSKGKKEESGIMLWTDIYSHKVFLSYRVCLICMIETKVERGLVPGVLWVIHMVSPAIISVSADCFHRQ